MGSIHKIGEEFYIEFYARGLKYQQKAGTNRAQAEKLLKDTEEKIAHGEMGTVVRDADVDIFMKDFLAYAKAEHPVKTLQRFSRTLKNLYDFVGKRFPKAVKLSYLTPNVFEQYKNFLFREKSVSAKAVNLQLILLREFCEYARKTGYLNDNPLLHIKFVPAVYRTLPYLSREKLPASGDVLEILQKKIPESALMRHTFAFYALQKNISLPTLAKMMGSEDIQEVMAYFPFLNQKEDLSSSAHRI